jgi:hypothetical protein
MQFAAEREYGINAHRKSIADWEATVAAIHAPHETLQDVLCQARAFGAWLISLRFFWAALMFGLGVGVGAMLP